MRYPHKFCTARFLFICFSANVGYVSAWGNTIDYPPRFSNPIVEEEKNGPANWQANISLCTYEKAFDGVWSLAIDSTPTPGNNWYFWSTKIDGIVPNTDYRISFDRMHDTLPHGTTGVARCYIFGREIPIPVSDQPRIWDKFTIMVNSVDYNGSIDFKILHYNDDKKTWFRNFQIEAVVAKPLSPVSGIELNCNNPLLVWQEMHDSSFMVQISQDSNFPSNATRNIGPILNKNSIQVDPPLSVGRWYWRVAAASATLIVPEQAKYSKPENFIVGHKAAQAPQLEMPKEVAPVALITKVTTNSQGVLLVNDKPVFLIGLYCVMEKNKLINNSYMTMDNIASCELLFQELSTAGFNTIHNYGTATDRVSEISAYLTLADKYKLWVLMQLHSVDGMNKEKVEKQIRMYSNHPSILTWLLVDEADMKGWSPIKAKTMRDYMRKVDPFRPIGIVVRDCSNYVNATDILLPDPYTLRSQPTPQYELHKMLAGYTQTAQKAITPKPVIAILQAFKYEDEFDKSNREHGRVPSFDEERCISYLAVATGHQGVIFYAYHSSATYLKDYPEHWADLKRLATELHQRTPIFLAPEVNVPGVVSGAGLVSFARRYNDAVYVFVINPGISPIEMKCTIAMKDVSVKCLETNREVKLATNLDFHNVLMPFEVQTYRITVAE